MNATDHAPDTERLWTVDETAKYLNVTKSWVYRHVASGELPHGKLGALIRFKPSLVREYAAHMIAQATTPNVVKLTERRTPSPHPRRGARR